MGEQRHAALGDVHVQHFFGNIGKFVMLLIWYVLLVRMRE
jgi:hypothetical protein